MNRHGQRKSPAWRHLSTDELGFPKTRSARVGPIYYLLWSVSTPNSAQCRSPVGLEGVVVAGGRTEVVVEGTVQKSQNGYDEETRDRPGLQCENLKTIAGIMRLTCKVLRLCDTRVAIKGVHEANHWVCCAQRPLSAVTCRGDAALDDCPVAR